MLPAPLAAGEVETVGAARGGRCASSAASALFTRFAGASGEVLSASMGS